MRKLKVRKIMVLILMCTSFVRPAAAFNEPVLVNEHGTLLTLSQAITRVFDSDARVKEAVERLNKESSLYKSKRAELFPTISMDLFQAVATGGKKNVTYFDAGITQPIFQGGKLRAEKSRQETRVKQEGLRLEEVKLNLKQEIENLYAQALEEKELTRLFQNMVRELQRHYQASRSLYEKELITNYERLRVESLLAKAKSGLVKHKETHDYLIEILKSVMGVSENESLELEPLKDVPDLDEGVESYLNSSKKDPLYQITELQIQEKGFEKRSIQAERFPHFDLVAKTNVNRDIFVDANRFMLGIVAKWDIWDFGKLGNQVKAKVHEMEEVKWAGEVKIKEKEKVIRKQYHEARALKEKIRLSEALVAEREEGYKNGKARIIAGDKGTEEMVESFLALQQAYAEQIQAITEYRMTISALNRQAAVEKNVEPKEVGDLS
ncbi:MAG TPA: TolC family protein [Candidatus Omnitrophota bacterium]|nr:TolC family protein [Candidatus Omnitrophota bacterium]